MNYKVKGIQVSKGDVLEFRYLDSNNNVCNVEEVTIKTIDHYNGDLYTVEFIEKQGSYAFLEQQLNAMKKK